jgi:hypothetical protein
MRKAVEIDGDLYWPCRFKANPELPPHMIELFLRREGLLSMERRPFLQEGNSRTSRDFRLVVSVGAEITVFVRVDLMPKVFTDILQYRYGRLRYQYQRKSDAAGAHLVPPRPAEVAQA